MSDNTAAVIVMVVATICLTVIVTVLVVTERLGGC